MKIACCLLATIGLSTTAHATRLDPFPFEQLPLALHNVDSGLCFGVHAGSKENIELQPCSDVDRQSFLATPIGGDLYQLRAAHRGEALVVVPGALPSAAFIAGGGPWMSFEMVPLGNDEVLLKSSASQLCLTPFHGLPGAEVAQGICLGLPSQRWKLVPRQRELQLALAGRKGCVEATGRTFGQPLVAAKCQGSQYADQTIVPRPLGNGAWQLELASPGLCINEFSRMIDAGACANNAAFTIQTDADGYSRLRSTRSDLCLAALGDKSQDAATIGLEPCSDADRQRFRFQHGMQRHLAIIQPATSVGKDRYVADPKELEQATARANEIFAEHGIEVLFDPAVDLIDVDSDALHAITWPPAFQLNQLCEPGFTTDSHACAERFADRYPDRIVVIIGPGQNAGTSFGSRLHGYITLAPGLGSNKCNTQLPWDTTLAHEVGHQLGLSHTFAAFDDEQHAAISAFSNRGVFEADLLEDTPPEPYLKGNDCLEPWLPSTTQTYTANPLPSISFSITLDVPTNNVMSYHFNVTPIITPQQGGIMRAVAYIRGL